MTLLTPTVTQQAKEAEIDRAPIKIAVIGALGMVASFFAVYRFTELLSSISLMNAIYAFVAVSIFLVIAVLQCFFIKSIRKLFLISLLEVLAAGSILWNQFYPSPSYIVIGGLVGFLVLLFFGMYEGARFLHEALSVRFAFVSRSILARAASGLLIFLAVVTYVWYFDFNNFNPADGAKIMATVVASAEPVLRVQFPGTSLNQTAETFFRKVAEAELRKLPKPQMKTGGTDEEIDWNVLSKQQQELLIQGTAETLRASFERAMGVSIPKNILLKDALFAFIKTKVENFSDKTSYYFGIIVAISVFFFLKSVLMILGPIIRFFAFVLYKILIMMGFAYISVETRNREFILLG